MSQTLSDLPLVNFRRFENSEEGNLHRESTSSLDLQLENEQRVAWQNFIEQTLLSWLADPRQLEDLEVEAPSKPIIRLAIDLAEKYRDDKLVPPDRIVPDPNGGIVFDRCRDGVAEVIHVWDDGTVEYQRFIGPKLVDRWSI